MALSLVVLTLELQLGESLFATGDINGDGKNDIIISAPNASPDNRGRAGQAYVIFGDSSFTSTFEVSTLNGTNGFTINGILLGDGTGSSVGLTNINNDNLVPMAF